MTRRPVRWWAFGLLVILSVPVVWLVFVVDTPTISRIVRGLWSRSLAWGFQGSPEAYGELLNVFLLMPGALLAAVWLPRVRWWVWGVLAAVVSTSIEAVQYFTPRDANGYDIVANTLGAAAGALAGSGINMLLEGRRSRLVEGPGGVLGEEPGGHHRDREHDPEQGEQHG